MSSPLKHSWETAAVFAVINLVIHGLMLDRWVDMLILTPICAAGGFAFGLMLNIYDNRDRHRTR